MTGVDLHPAQRPAHSSSTDAHEYEKVLELFGTSVRLLAGPPARGDAPSAQLASAAAEASLRRYQRALTRFDADSELSLLNADPRTTLPSSDLMVEAVAAAIWAAERSSGLVDPTLLGPLERAGYEHSRAGAVPAPLREALRCAPTRRPAAPSVGAPWRSVSVNDGTIRRPAGMRLDLGGTAKGLAADRAASLLSDQTTFAIDAGGDIVIGGVSGVARQVSVAHPLEPSTVVFDFELALGAVATSGLAKRVWRTPGGYAHHLIDPSIGLPAWTGVIQATALAESGLEAETLAKAALLSGPQAGFAILEAAGGVLVLDDGEVLVTESLQRPREAAA
jgi:thiamine biosynthesis lipoprotein